MEKLIDLSQVIKDEMPVYPGDLKTSLFQTQYLSVHKYNSYRLDINSHAGTHIDSPMHLTERRRFIGELPLESFIGVGSILDVRKQPVIKMKTEYVGLIKEGSIVLLYTGYDQVYGKPEYYHGHPVVDPEFARFLLSKKVKMLGMDLPSPDEYPFPVHKLLLENNVYILENLANLDKLLNLPAFEVIAFPLKIRADSSIARVVARVI
mgnify:CR=1 FL=1